MRWVCPLAVVCITVLSASAGWCGDPAPALKVLKPEVDLGAQKAGPTLWFPFKLRNEGSAPLQIRDVQVSCGCMAARYDPQVAPGKESTLWIKMATTDKDGPTVKYIRLTTNDPTTPVMALTAKATLEAPIQVQPGRAVILMLKPHEEATRDITLLSHESAPLEISRVENSASKLITEVLPPGKDPHVRTVRLKVPAAAAEPFDGSLVLHTNSKRLPQIRLEVEGVGEGAVYVLPRRLYFADVYEEPTRPATRMLMLMRQEKPFTIVSVKSDDPALEVKPSMSPKTEGDKGAYGEIVVTYKGGWKPGKIEGKITLTLSDTDWPTVEIPYSGDVHAGKDPGKPETAATAPVILPSFTFVPAPVATHP